MITVSQGSRIVVSNIFFFQIPEKTSSSFLQKRQWNRQCNGIGATSVKKHCFCHFQAVFGDFGQNVPPPRDPVRETLLERANIFHWQFRWQILSKFIIGQSFNIIVPVVFYSRLQFLKFYLQNSCNYFMKIR